MGSVLMPMLPGAAPPGDVWVPRCKVLPYQNFGGVFRPNRPNYHTQISSFAWQFTVQIKSMSKLTVLECQWRPNEVPQIPSRAGA
jgi:hypothetical protein